MRFMVLGCLIGLKSKADYRPDGEIELFVRSVDILELHGLQIHGNTHRQLAALVADVNGCTQIWDSKYSTFYTQRLPGRKSYRPYT